MQRGGETEAEGQQGSAQLGVDHLEQDERDVSTYVLMVDGLAVGCEIQRGFQYPRINPALTC